MGVLAGYRHVQGTSKKTGKPFDAYVVSYLEDEDPRQNGVGFRAEQQFVDAPLFEAAVANIKPDQILNSHCQLVYDRNGYLTSFSVTPAKAQ